MVIVWHSSCLAYILSPFISPMKADFGPNKSYVLLNGTEQCDWEVRSQLSVNTTRKEILPKGRDFLFYEFDNTQKNTCLFSRKLQAT